MTTPMSRGDQIKNRLRELRGEFEAYQKRLSELDSEATQLRATLLRIAGAIQVLEETLAAGGAAPARTTAE